MKKYKELTFVAMFIIVSILGFSSKKFSKLSNDNFRSKIDSLKTIIPVVDSGNFDFQSFAQKNLWSWYTSKKLKQIDNDFYKNYLVNNTIFNEWNDYQTLYFCSIINYNNIYLVIAQRVHNGDESNMFLVCFNDFGKILNVFLLARIEKSPDDFLVLKSKLTNKGQILSTKTYITNDNINPNIYYKDSVIYHYSLNNIGKATKTATDSVRFRLKGNRN